MATIANGGTLYQTHIVRQVQTLNSQVVYSYSPRPRDILGLSAVTREELRQAMLGVVNSGNGTAGSAAVNGVKVAGKTGTAQWGPKSKERTAAWFAGFAPADNPQYAYAALYEGAPGEYAHGGTKAAPMIGDLLRVLFKDQAKNGEKEKTEQDEEPQDSEDRQTDQSN